MPRRKSETTSSEPKEFRLDGLISMDTETTGVDLYHGVQPFIVTMCDDKNNTVHWEWDVDPLTRRVDVPRSEAVEVQEVLDACRRVVFQNPKFDAKALSNVGVKIPWDKVDDTLMMGHLLDSKMPHNLTDMVIHYLKVDISKYERALEKCCKEARSYARANLKDWMIAQGDMPSMPSVLKGGDNKKSKKRGSENDKPWKFDAFLPREVAKHRKLPKSHPYWTVCTEYADEDSVSTRMLFIKQMMVCQKRGLLPHYRERLKLLPVVARMERRGVTISGGRLEESIKTYSKVSIQGKATCEEIAAKRNFTFTPKSTKSKINPKPQPFVLPAGARSDALESFIFDELKVPVVGRTEAGGRAMDKDAMSQWLHLYESDKESDQYRFLSALADKRRRDTALSYMAGYKRFWFKLKKLENWYRLHPNFNPTGTDTLRFGCSNPNAQNVSKKKGFNLRYNFGPAPGREWWALDYENLELRIPAYEAGETLMTDLFENPNDPPYFGSYHMLVFSILHPEMWKKWGTKIKDSDCPDSAWYGYTKNGNFAVQYGAVASSGTADAAYHVKGGQAIIENRFTNIKLLAKRIMAQAETFGYVETMPRKSVDPKKGYPLTCTRTQYNRILPTVPLSYHVQGTAMECTTGSMIRCDEKCLEWTHKTGRDHFITMQVHDELVFDFPKGGKKNLDKVYELKYLMEESGRDIGVPLKVSVGYHPCNWSETQAL